MVFEVAPSPTTAAAAADQRDVVAVRGRREVLDVLLPLDECRSGRSAEDILVNGYHLEPQQLVVNRRGDNFLAVKALIYGVRKHGSYKRYMRAPHRDVLACRGLAQRGKMSTEHRALNFLARQGDNGIVWTILSYWRATK